MFGHFIHIKLWSEFHLFVSLKKKGFRIVHMNFWCVFIGEDCQNT